MKVLSLTRRMHISLIAGFVAACSLALLLLQLYLGKSHYQEVLRGKEDVGNSITEGIAVHFNQSLRILQQLAVQLGEGPAPGSGGQADADRVLQLQTVKRLGMFHNLSLLSLQGTLLATTRSGQNPYRSDLGYQKTLQQVRNTGEAQVTPVLFAPGSRDPGLFFIHPVRDTSGRVLGTLQGHYDLTGPYFLNHSATLFRGLADRFYIVDRRSGCLLAGSDSGFSGFQALQEHPLGLLLQHILQQPQQKGLMTDVRGAEWFYIQRTEPLSGWTLVQLTPRDEVQEHLSEAQIMMTTLLVVLMLLMSLMLTFSIRKHMRPLARLISQLQQRVLDKQMLQPLPMPDYSELRPLVRAINELLYERRRQEQAKDDFLAMISHELRTPLTSVKGSLAFITPENESQQRLLQVAQRNTERAVLLVSDLLDLAAITQGDLRLELACYDAAYLIGQCIEEIQPLLRSHSLQLDFAPDLRDPLRVMVDAQRFKQVVTNLLSNAIKFSPQQSRITVTLKKHQGEVRVGVKDEGIGIPQYYQTYIFQRFSRAQGSNVRQSEGSGLGLAISRELVSAMGGSIHFHSIEQVGSYFYFQLPQASAPPERLPEAALQDTCEHDSESVMH